MIDQTQRNHLRVALSAARQCAKTDHMKGVIDALLGDKTLTGTAINGELARLIPLADADEAFNADWMTLAEVSEGIGENYG